VTIHGDVEAGGGSRGRYQSTRSRPAKIQMMGEFQAEMESSEDPITPDEQVKCWVRGSREDVVTLSKKKFMQVGVGR